MAIKNSDITSNTVDVLYVFTVTQNSKLEIEGTTFTNNSILHYGNKGVIFTSTSITTMKDSCFAYNGAKLGGVILLQERSSFSTANCTFVGNVAEVAGVAYCTGPGTVNVTHSTFERNRV